MFEEVLQKDAERALALLEKSGLLKNAYLAGGTALALQIGHRISVDFDFFTPKKFRVLRQNKMHIIKSLVYFEDAEKDLMPRMIKDVEWSKVKNFFKRETKSLTNFPHYERSSKTPPKKV